MKRLYAAVIVSCGLILASGATAEDRKPPVDDRRPDASTRKTPLEEACDCCRACREATKEIKSKDDGVPARNGCRECCSRCGDDTLPDKKKRIPEMIR